MTRRVMSVGAGGLALALIWVWLASGSGDSSPGGGIGGGRGPAPLAERVRVEVLNAGGRTGAARSATASLRDAGYDVVHFGNASSFDEDSTRVIDRVGRPEVARDVARALGIGNVHSEPDPNLYVDVSVVLGADWDDEEVPVAHDLPTRGRRWWDPRGWFGR